MPDYGETYKSGARQIVTDYGSPVVDDSADDDEIIPFCRDLLGARYKVIAVYLCLSAGASGTALYQLPALTTHVDLVTFKYDPTLPK